MQHQVLGTGIGAGGARRQVSGAGVIAGARTPAGHLQGYCEQAPEQGASAFVASPGCMNLSWSKGYVHFRLNLIKARWHLLHTAS